MRITAARLNDRTLDDSTTSGLVASAGFSVSSFSARKIFGVVTVQVIMSRTGADITELATNTGNITDTPLATLPAGWCPVESINTVYGTGTVDGECTITSAGLITLRSISGNASVANLATVRVYASFIVES
jgi:hypothetical protein